MNDIEQEIVGSNLVGNDKKNSLLNESIVFPVKEINYMSKYPWLGNNKSSSILDNQLRLNSV